MEAVERHGVVRGGLMAVWRLLRCHPLAKGGLDTVVKDASRRPGARPQPLKGPLTADGIRHR
jgi:putative component of membrane protein insertase Oxa1/YidC/SpoIIIJ protein YidD